MAGYGAAVHSGTIEMVRSTRVLSGGGVVKMETVMITMLHPRGSGKPELPPSTEVVSPASEHSSRMVCRDGDLLCTIPTNMTPELLSPGKDSGY
jgi:hypothetical protein